MSERCTCTDCAENSGNIEKLDNFITEMYIVTDPTKAHKAAYESEGDECTIDHNHQTSKSCTLMYVCDNCSETYEEEDEAENCCETWTCTFCGSEFSDTYWGSPKDNAAACCVMACDECGEMGWPDFIENHSCENSRGMRRQLPWEARGIVVDARNPVEDRYYETGDEPWRATWGFAPEKLDVVRAAADYYLLEAITAGLVGTTDGKGSVNGQLSGHSSVRIIRDEAQSLMNALVDIWDEVLVNYTHMAVGGELRHHNSVGGEVLSGNRDSAWVGWKLIFEAVGPDALVDANELFLEFGGGSFGGKPWGDACLILHARLTGKISRQMFLDRIFNHQHNGGNFLNKVQWAGDRRKANDYYGKNAWSLSDMTNHLLPAHGAEPEPDYPILLAYASPEVRRLFNDSWEYAGHAARDLGISLSFRPTRPSSGMTKSQVKRAYEKKAAAEVAAYNKANAPKKALADLNVAKSQLQAYEGYLAEVKAANAKAKANPTICTCGCGETLSSEDTYTEEYYAEMVENYKQQIIHYQAKYDALTQEAEPASELTFEEVLAWDGEDEPF